MTAAQLIREARRGAGMTQRELAAQLGMSQPAVARLERPGSNPTWDTLVRALRATGNELRLAPRPGAAVPLDTAQLRERLRLSPAERLRSFQASQHRLLALRASARRRGGA